MDLTYTPADEAFRARVKEFIARHVPGDWRGCGALDRSAYDAWAEDWRKALLEGRLARRPGRRSMAAEL